MKLKECPECDSSNLGDFFQENRQLAQHCYECGWNGKKRIPEQREIKISKKIMIGHFYGYHFEIFDQYGVIITSSKYYAEEGEAKLAMVAQLKQSNESPNASPCTAVFWPDFVEVKAEVWK